MKVSIITPTYNSASTLRTNLESIRLQQYSNIEQIIIDGGSSDDTIKTIQGFEQVKHIISEPDAGVYDAMNKGIRMASGDIIGILNSDDLYVHAKVISQVVQIMESAKTDSLYADLVYVKRTKLERVVRYWNAKELTPKSFYYGWMPPHPTFFVRRWAYEKYGLFNLKLKRAADYELMMRFLLKHKISTCYLPEVIVKMRVGGQSNRSIFNRLDAHREDRLAWKLNHLKPRFYTALAKPISKIPQFFLKNPRPHPEAFDFSPGKLSLSF